MIVLNDIQFYSSVWGFYDVDIIMTNCDTSSLLLSVNTCNSNSTLANFTSSVNIQNCTFGCWRFQCIDDVQISDCGIKGTPSCDSKIIIDIIRSSAILENVSFHRVNVRCTFNELCGFVVGGYSTVQIRNSFYEKNKSPFKVQIGSSLLLENCTFLENDERNGIISGAVGVIISIINCRIEENTAYLGIIYVEIDSSVTVSGSTFISNHESCLVVISDSALDISNSTFKNNRGAVGAGINVRFDSNLTISTTIFDGNSAEISGGAGGAGGAVFIDLINSAFFTNSIFINNRVDIGGGAIAVQRSKATLSNLIINQNKNALSVIYNRYMDIHNCTFSKNVDGAILAVGNIRLIVRKSDFLDNEAKDGGAMLVQLCKNVTLSHVRLFHNVASLNGGAIISYFTNLYVDSSIFEDNAAFFDRFSVSETSHKNVSSHRSDFGSGGALYIYFSHLFMSNCIARHSYAVNAGVILGTNSDINLTNCLFEYNTADFNGGVMSITNSTLRVDNVIYKNNTVYTAAEGGGGAISAQRCRVYISNSIFEENTMPVGSAGAIHISSYVLQIFNTTFSNNSANWGGALEVNDAGEFSNYR